MLVLTLAFLFCGLSSFGEVLREYQRSCSVYADHFLRDKSIDYSSNQYNKIHGISEYYIGENLGRFQDSTVKYLDKIERVDYRLNVVGGKLTIGSEEVPFCKDVLKYIYVMDLSGNIYWKGRV